MGLSDDNNKDVFSVSGPTHMMTQTGIEIDWDNEDHRRCVTACLVKGTYVLESDRAKRRQPVNALAPAWWESFYFRRLSDDYELEFKCECVFCTTSRRISGARGRWFIFGAIFQYGPPNGARRHPSAPSYVVAFRGTMPWDPTIFPDMRHNLRILLNKQHLCGRFRHARDKVRQLLDSITVPNVWLAGHSLGASIALDVGRHMMTKKDLNLPAFLFNPPHVSLAPAISVEAKTDVYTVGYIGKHFLGKILTLHKDCMEELFEKLRPWQPNLYVHERDDICKGFIHYFEQREIMKTRLRPNKVTVAATLSYRDMCHSLFGKQSERPHLLPSAVLRKNQSQHGEAHELQQWWQKKLVLSHNPYTWP